MGFGDRVLSILKQDSMRGSSGYPALEVCPEEADGDSLLGIRTNMPRAPARRESKGHLGATPKINPDIHPTSPRTSDILLDRVARRCPRQRYGNSPVHLIDDAPEVRLYLAKPVALPAGETQRFSPPTGSSNLIAGWRNSSRSFAYCPGETRRVLRR